MKARFTKDAWPAWIGVTVMAALVRAASVERLTWAPGSTGREWDVAANWSGKVGEYPDELHEEAYFYSPALQPLLDRDIWQLGRLTFGTAGWIIEQDGTNQYIMVFYATSNDYNAVYSAGSGTNTILPGLGFNVNGQNVYSAANNVLVVRRVAGPNACVFSSTTPAQDNTGIIVLDGNNSGVTQPFVVRQGTLVVAHPQALGGSSQTIYLGDGWSATNARARLFAGTNGLVISKPIEVRDYPGLVATLGCAPGVTNATFSGALTVRRATLFSGPTNATLVVSGVVSGGGSVIVSNVGLLVIGHPASSYSGGTTVLGSTLRVVTNNALGSGLVALTNGVLELRHVVISNDITAQQSVIRGFGSVAGAVRLLPGSALTPGLSVGRVTMDFLEMASNSTFVVEINGAGAGMYDSVGVMSSCTLARATLQPVLGYEPVYGDVLTLLEMIGSGQINGEFAGYPEGAEVGIPGGLKPYIFRVTYVGGTGSNDMQLICVPEACGWAVLLLGMLTTCRQWI